MTVASIEFIFLLLASSAFYAQLDGRRARLAFFCIANALALSSLIPNWPSVLVLTGFLLSGYFAARSLARRPSNLALSIYLLTLVAAFLVLKKYEFLKWLVPTYLFEHPIGIIGLSYMLFRQIHFVVDSMQGQIPNPTLWSYLNYQLNLFGILSGPIQRFQAFDRYWQNPRPILADQHDLLKALLRINLGVIKLAAIATVFYYAFETASNTLLQVHDGYLVQMGSLRHAIYFLIMLYSFPAYLYFNFSGYCDIVIGGGALFGIRMPENFDRPYVARNMIDFWNRWHRTLSHWIRDYIFMPLYKAAVERTPSFAEPLSVAFFFVALFLAGVWHGSTTNWVIFGALNGMAVAFVKLWEVLLIRVGGRSGLRKYTESRIIRLFATTLNLNFVAFMCLFFPEDIHRTIKIITVVIGS